MGNRKTWSKSPAKSPVSVPWTSCTLQSCDEHGVMPNLYTLHARSGAANSIDGLNDIE